MIRTLSAIAVLTCVSSAFAQVGIDGVIGADWTSGGAITRNVFLDPAAPLGNFGAPTNANHLTAYTTYMRADASYVYLAVGASPAASLGSNTFMNIYLSTNPAVGSNIGLEVGNNNFFIPGGAGGFSAVGITNWANNPATGVMEVAIPFSFFTTDPLGMGFSLADPTTGIVQWRLSQSLGYSVAGGAQYGADRLGIVPTPGAAALMGVGILASARRRRA